MALSYDGSQRQQFRSGPFSALWASNILHKGKVSNSCSEKNSQCHSAQDALSNFTNEQLQQYAKLLTKGKRSNNAHYNFLMQKFDNLVHRFVSSNENFGVLPHHPEGMSAFLILYKLYTMFQGGVLA
jgi:hypothetical protein